MSPANSNSSKPSELIKRLNHKHYITNGLLCLPLPILLIYNLDKITTTALAALAGGPVFMALSMFNSKDYAGEIQIYYCLVWIWVEELKY